MSPLLLFVIIIFLYGIYKSLISMKRPNNYPPGPLFTPILGNTMQLRKCARLLGGQHIALAAWARKYKSDIIGLKVGSEYVVYVQNHELVKQVQLEEVFEARPDNFFIRLRTMGTRQGITCTEGKLWHDHRLFAMKQLRNVGYGRSQMDELITLEAEDLADYIRQLKGKPVWPGSFLAPSVISVLWSLAAGTRIGRDNKQLQHLLDLLNKRSKVFDMCGGILTQFPWLRYIAPNKTGYKLICDLNQDLYEFLMEAISEHKARWTPDLKDNDLIFAYLNEMQQQKTDKANGGKTLSFNETQLVMTILDLFIAGSQTTSTTLDLSLMMLALHPDIQSKVYQELRDNMMNGKAVGNKAETESSQLANDESESLKSSSKDAYPYLNAFLLEVQRYFSIVPISGPRRALWNTTLGGYDIPKDTTILIGLQTVHMDQNHWSDPKSFYPERFLTSDLKLKQKDEFLMPFGIGRRRCLGDKLARACLFQFVAQIVLEFRLELTDEESPCTTLLPGITLSPKPYKIRFIRI